MQEREKKLAAGLGVVLVVAFVVPTFESWFLQPISDAKNELAAAQQKLDTLTESESRLKLAKLNLEDWHYESLPPNPYTAQRKYQEWLMDLARMSGLETPMPSLGNVSPSSRVFVEIPVTIEARATFEQLARFLYHLERVSLLHRVQSVDIKSPASIGNPRLDVRIDVRGLSLVDAPERSRLFSATALTQDVAADAQTLDVEELTGFPTIDGFQVKIGAELLTVRQLSGTEWTVERGAEATLAVAHPAGSVVELFPVDRDRLQSDRSFEEYLELLQHSPFAKPAPPFDATPELTPTELQVVTRGEPWKLKLNLTGWDPAGGPALYSLADGAPGGLTIDAATGELSWEAGPDIEAKTYEVVVTAKSDVLSGQQVELKLPVKLREPNLPPTIAKLEPLTAYSGRPLSVEIEADDPDGENDALKYSLTGEVPAGAAIDEQGVLKWTPPLTLELKEYKLTVSVADSGDPQQTTTQEVTVKLEDDAALFTRFVGFFENDGRSEAILNNLTSGKTTHVAEGAVIDAADVQGTVVGIEPRHLVLQVGEQTYRLGMGENLRQMTLIESTTSAPPADDSDPET